jgi:hypothetical protein
MQFNITAEGYAFSGWRVFAPDSRIATFGRYENAGCPLSGCQSPGRYHGVALFFAEHGGE